VPDDPIARRRRGIIVVEATALVLAFVMDLDRYRQADHKIRRIRRTQLVDGDVVVAMWTRFAGLPVAATQRMQLTPGARIDVHNEPSWQDRFTSFHGEFVCRPVAGGGTEVTHRYTLTFKGMAKVMTPLLRSWLARDIGQEVARLAALVGREPDAPVRS
jgi:hypothetical protein